MVTFVPETHTYFDDSGEPLISVTQLMAKHGLSPDYSKVDMDMVRAKAERGTLIHKEIEEFLKEGTIGFTKELQNFVKWYQEVKPDLCRSEVIVNNDVCAGTLDLIYTKNGKTHLADIKTTYELHRDSVSWQLSIYKKLASYHVDDGQAFHFDKDGNLEVVDIAFKPEEEVQKLFECERKGQLYERDYSAVISPAQIAKIEEAETLIALAKKTQEQAEQTLKVIKEALVKIMEENAITTFTANTLRFTYISPYKKQVLDTARIKKEMPEISEKYTKTQDVGASVKIEVKK